MNKSRRIGAIVAMATTAVSVASMVASAPASATARGPEPVSNWLRPVRAFAANWVDIYWRTDRPVCDVQVRVAGRGVDVGYPGHRRFTSFNRGTMLRPGRTDYTSVQITPGFDRPGAALLRAVVTYDNCGIHARSQSRIFTLTLPVLRNDRPLHDLPGGPGDNHGGPGNGWPGDNGGPGNDGPGHGGPGHGGPGNDGPGHGGPGNGGPGNGGPGNGGPGGHDHGQPGDNHGGPGGHNNQPPSTTAPAPTTTTPAPTTTTTAPAPTTTTTAPTTTTPADGSGDGGHHTRPSGGAGDNGTGGHGHGGNGGTGATGGTGGANGADGGHNSPVRRG